MQFVPHILLAAAAALSVASTARAQHSFAASGPRAVQLSGVIEPLPDQPPAPLTATPSVAAKNGTSGSSRTPGRPFPGPRYPFRPPVQRISEAGDEAPADESRLPRLLPVSLTEFFQARTAAASDPLWARATVVRL